MKKAKKIKKTKEKNMRIAVKKLNDNTFELTSLESKYTTVTIRILREESRKLDEVAEKLGITKSELVKRAIKEFLKNF